MIDWQKIAISRGEEIERLEAQLALLRGVLAPPVAWPFVWGLTRRESALLSCVAAHERIDVAMATRALDQGEGEVSKESAYQHMTKLREKLRAHGIEISARYGVGYELTPATRQIVLEAARNPNNDLYIKPRHTG